MSDPAARSLAAFPRRLAQALRRRLVARASLPPAHVVPLGLSCRVAYQVRTCFASATAYPFDWWLTPIDALTRYLLRPDPERIYGRGALAELVVGDQISAIVAPEFGFQLFHEFPRQDIGRPARVVAPDWRDHVAAARNRHTQRLDRFLALDQPGNRILFVRDRLDAESGSGLRAPAESVAGLWHALSKLFPRAGIELLLINVPALRLPHQSAVRRIDFVDPPGEPPEAWRGDSERWARAFAAAGYRTRPGGGATAAPVGPPD